MTSLKKFYCEFISYFEGFNFSSEFEDEHTLRLRFGSLVSCVFLRYVVTHCPESCVYFVSFMPDVETGEDYLYICVYDD